MRILFNYSFIFFGFLVSTMKILIFLFSLICFREASIVSRDSENFQVYEGREFADRRPFTIILISTSNVMSLRRNLCFITTRQSEEFEMSGKLETNEILRME